MLGQIRFRLNVLANCNNILYVVLPLTKRVEGVFLFRPEHCLNIRLQSHLVDEMFDQITILNLNKNCLERSEDSRSFFQRIYAMVTYILFI